MDGNTEKCNELALSDILVGGLAVAENELLAGCKYAILQDGTLHVSPAVWRLMDGAESEELEHLLSNLTVLVIPTVSYVGVGRPMFGKFGSS